MNLMEILAMYGRGGRPPVRPTHNPFGVDQMIGHPSLSPGYNPNNYGPIPEVSNPFAGGRPSDIGFASPGGGRLPIGSPNPMKPGMGRPAMQPGDIQYGSGGPTKPTLAGILGGMPRGY